jgi:hypothetical protein
MSTTVGAGQGPDSGMGRGALRIWLRLFLGISGAAVAIAAALGLLVVLASSAVQAQASPRAENLPAEAASATGAVVPAAPAHPAGSQPGSDVRRLGDG